MMMMMMMIGGSGKKQAEHCLGEAEGAAWEAGEFSLDGERLARDDLARRIQWQQAASEHVCQATNATVPVLSLERARRESCIVQSDCSGVHR